MLELLEVTCVLNTLEDSGTRYLYYFRGYEKDANFCTLLLQSKNIYVHKIPSGNPLSNFYSSTIADAFSFTAPFQSEEYQILKMQWFVDRVLHWPIFNFYKLDEFIIEKNPVKKRKVLGLYTRGMWLRNERGDKHLGVGEEVAEEAMLSFTRKLLAENKELELVIFLHPTERSTAEMYERAKNYYHDFFDLPGISFAERTAASFRHFSDCEIGIASVSSVNIERLYCGFKTFYVNTGIKTPLFGRTKLSSVCIYDFDEFRAMISSALCITENEFFRNYDLSAYRHST